jgi:hypothetical protein
MSMRKALCWSTPHLRTCAVCENKEGPTPSGYSVMEWWTEASLGAWLCSSHCMEWASKHWAKVDLKPHHSA